MGHTDRGGAGRHEQALCPPTADNGWSALLKDTAKTVGAKAQTGHPLIISQIPNSLAMFSEECFDRRDQYTKILFYFSYQGLNSNT